MWGGFFCKYLTEIYLIWYAYGDLFFTFSYEILFSLIRPHEHEPIRLSEYLCPGYYRGLSSSKYIRYCPHREYSMSDTTRNCNLIRGRTPHWSDREYWDTSQYDSAGQLYHFRKYTRSREFDRNLWYSILLWIGNESNGNRDPRDQNGRNKTDIYEYM